MTTSANTDMQRLHDRMTVILESLDWPVWLGAVSTDLDVPLSPAATGMVRLWPGSRAVNRVRNNSAALLDAVDDPAAPPPSYAPAGANPA
jgi:putative SOS response-associated peptidase YedK